MSVPERRHGREGGLTPIATLGVCKGGAQLSVRLCKMSEEAQGAHFSLFAPNRPALNTVWLARGRLLQFYFKMPGVGET